MERNLVRKIFIDGEEKTKSIYSIYLLGEYYHVIFNNNLDKMYNYKQDRVKIENIVELKNDVYDYLKELSDKLSIKKNDSPYAGDEIKILKKYYDEFTLIEDDSILINYLYHKKITEKSSIDTPIFPFSFNPHQKLACENALESNVSIIDGPPGTGKTQTILNIIANVLIQNKTVAVISNNNSAIDNVYEKMQKYGLDKICALLGKTSRINEFVNESKRSSFPNAWKNNNISFLKVKLKKSLNSLEKYLTIQNKVAELKQRLKAVILEQKYYKNNKSNNLNMNSKKILKCHSYIDILNNNKIDLSSLSRLVLRINGFDNEILSYSVNDILDYLEVNYYHNLIKELKNKIKKLEGTLKQNDFKGLLDEYVNDSMKLLKYHIFNNYGPCDIISSKEIKKMSEFSKKYPVILSTTYSLTNCINDGYKFDYLIVDESSQVDLVTSFLALSCAKNIVVVGDLKQLPTIVDKTMQKENNTIIKKYKVPQEWDYGKMNLLSSTISLFPKAPHVMLKEHYRCHPEIIGFCNERFYDSKLIILSKNTNENPLVIKQTTPGNYARKEGKSWFNQRQISTIKDEVYKEQGFKESSSVGIISPYKSQCDKIKDSFDYPVEALTVHKFQGRERDNIIFTTTGNRIDGFINDPCLINVAISRAKDKFILVTHNGCEKENSLITDLILYMQYHNCKISYSNISSVFDILYKVQEDQKNLFIKTHRLIRKYLSENLIYYTLKEIIEKDFKILDFRCSYRLKSLIINYDDLTKEEIRFIKTNSHLDFLVYKKFNKEPVLAVEVDGRWHLKPDQKKRDRTKDSILKKKGVPILRLPTHGDREKEKIINKIIEVLN